MKNKAFLLFCLISYGTNILAQDYQISFGIQGVEEFPDIVTVCNLDQSICLDIEGCDVLHLVDEFVGVRENEVSNPAINVYPNPITDQAFVEFYNPNAGEIRVFLSDLSGKLMEMQTYHLPRDFNAFEISGLSKGIYALRVQGENFYYTTLLISTGSSNRQSETYITQSLVQQNQVANESQLPEGIQLKSVYTSTDTIQMRYKAGEQLLFTAFKDTKQSEVSLTPAGDQEVDFDFSPRADFIVNSTSCTAGTELHFTDQSSNKPTSWDWDFGDGGSSSQQHPTYIYSIEGTYTVSLTATNEYGSDSETKANYMTVNELALSPVAGFAASPTTIIEGEIVSFTDESLNDPTSWLWDFGDGGASTDQSPSHQYTSAGSYTVSLTATNDHGSGLETKTAYITVNASAVAPVLMSTFPEVGYSHELAVSGAVVLVFDKAVIYDETKDLTFTELYDNEDVVAGSVTVDFNEVTVTSGEKLSNGDFVMLSYPEGAFIDYSGNLVAEMDSYYDINEGLLRGLYWGVETRPFEAQSVSPADSSLIAASAFDIVVAFEQAVDATNVATGDITISYDDGLDVLNRSVLVSEVSTSGNELIITASYKPSPGMKVTLNIPEGILDIGYRNPNAAFTANWEVESNLDELVGSYGVYAASYGNPGIWDENWTATVELIPGNDTALSITIDAGFGGGTPFLAAFDLDSMKIRIAPATLAGNLYQNSNGINYGPVRMYESDYSYISTSDTIVGEITGNNGFTIDLLGFFLTDYEVLWDAFNTTWTKTSTKAAISTRSINQAKAARFK